VTEEREVHELIGKSHLRLGGMKEAGGAADATRGLNHAGHHVL
jgi:hypothetical protein